MNSYGENDLENRDFQVSEIENTLSGAHTGLWRLIAEEGHKLRLIANKTMCDLLGIGYDLSPEENAEFLMNNIVPEDAARFKKYSDNLINVGRDEIVYKWRHPQKGICYMRCGGWRDRVENGKTIIRGYHQDVTDIMLSRERSELAVKMISGDYFRICYVDLDSDRIYDLKCDVKQPDNCNSFSGYIRYLIDDGFIDRDFKAMFAENMSLDKIKSELEEKNEPIEFVYSRISNGRSQWAKSIIVPTENYSNENLCIIWYVKNIDEEMAKELLLERKQAELSRAHESIILQDNLIKSLGCSYNFSYYMDIVNGTYTKVDLTKLADNIIYSDDVCTDTLEQYINYDVTEPYRDRMSEFMDLETVSERIGTKKIISQDYLNKNGSWIRTSFVPVKWDKEGNLTHVLLAGQDIDEERRKELKQQNALKKAYDAEKAALKQAEATQAETEALLRKIQSLNSELEKKQKEIISVNERLEKANKSITAQLETFLHSVNGGFKVSKADELFTFQYVSDAIAANQGYTVDEFMKACGGTAAGNVYQPDLARVDASLRRQLGAGDVYTLKYRVCCKDGGLKWIMDTGRRGIGDDGSPIFNSIIMDIDKFERINVMYRQERKQYRDAIIHDCEYTFSFDVTHGFIEQKFILKNGDDPIALLGLSVPVRFNDFINGLKDYIIPSCSDIKAFSSLTSERLADNFAEGNRNVELDYYDSRLKKFIRLNFLMTENEENGHILAIVIGKDITAQKQEEEKNHKALEEANKILELQKKELEKAYTEAKLANAAKSDFLARMSHDIRTPINGILGLIEMDERYPNNIEKINSNREKAKLTANHLLSLVNDVLDMSKMESGNIVLTEEPFNMRAILRECQEIISPAAHDKKLNCVTRNKKVLEHPNVIGSPLHVKQILMNLMSNAVKYNRDGGSIYGEVQEVSCDDTTVVYRFIIEDTGIGMSEEFQKKMFEPFTQENDGSRGKYQGTGLGMTIVKKITDKMNGTIEVFSKKDVGSKFIVTIPFKLDNGKTQQAENAEAYEADIHGRKVLLVEDNDLNTEIAKFMLEESGAAVETAVNGREAVDAFAAKENYYDVILMDIMMPVMDGYEAAEKIRSMDRDDAKHIPIIAMTANAFTDDIEKCRNAGMNAHIAKPLDMKNAVSVIAKHIEAYRR